MSSETSETAQRIRLKFDNSRDARVKSLGIGEPDAEAARTAGEAMWQADI